LGWNESTATDFDIKIVRYFLQTTIHGEARKEPGKKKKNKKTDTPKRGRLPRLSLTPKSIPWPEIRRILKGIKDL